MLGKQDKDLVRRIRKGNPKAENELFSRFGERIERQVRFSLGDRLKDWQDIASEIKIAVLMNLRNGRFRSDGQGSLATYIFAITRNHIRTYFKRRDVIDTGDMSFQAQIDCEVNSKLEHEEDEHILERLLGELKPKYQEVLYLRFYEGLTVRHISEKIDLPPRRVSERIYYALRLLRKECEKKKLFQY